MRVWRSTGGFYVVAGLALALVLVAGTALVPRVPVATANLSDIPPDRIVARVSTAADYPPALRAALAAHRAAPGDAGLAMTAARQVVDEGRSRGDARLVGAALGILRPFLDTAPATMLRVAADARQYQHDFPGALSLLDRAAALDPRDADVRLMRATIHTVRGDYAAARADCSALAATGLREVGFLCTATTHVLTADGPGWAQRLDDILSRPGLLDPALHPWALGLMAEIARHQGDTAQSRQLLTQVLALDPAAEREKLLLADLMLANGEGAAVLGLLKASPDTDGVLLRRTLALRLVGSPEAQSLARLLDQRFRLNIDLGLRAHAREEAMFFLYLARDPALALARAQVNWAQQHEAEDIALLLAAADAAGDPAAARPVLDWMARAGVTPPPPLPPAGIPAPP